MGSSIQLKSTRHRRGKLIGHNQEKQEPGNVDRGDNPKGNNYVHQKLSTKREENVHPTADFYNYCDC